MRRALSAHLQVEDGLTVNQYAALLLLSKAEEHHMRRGDVADGLQLTPSGVSRLLDGLEEFGLVEKGNSQRAGRITYAVLTNAGRTKLEQASRSHRAGVRALFAQRYSDHEPHPRRARTTRRRRGLGGMAAARIELAHHDFQAAVAALERCGNSCGSSSESGARGAK